MQTAKQEIEAMVRALPEDASYEDAQYKLYVLEKIHNGLESIDQNGGVSQEDAKARFAKWLKD